MHSNHSDSKIFSCRFVAGVNAGAIIDLEPGYYLFGNSDQAFFRVDQENVLARHFALEVVSKLEQEDSNLDPQSDKAQESKALATSLEQADNLSPYKFLLHTLDGSVTLNTQTIEPHQTVECHCYDVILFCFNEIILAQAADPLNLLLDKVDFVKNQILEQKLAQKEEEIKLRLEQEYAQKLALATEQIQANLSTSAQNAIPEQNADSANYQSAEQDSEQNASLALSEQDRAQEGVKSNLTENTSQTDSLDANSNKEEQTSLFATLFSLKTVFLILALVALSYFFYLLAFKNTNSYEPINASTKIFDSSSLTEEEKLEAFFHAFKVKNYALTYENGGYKVSGVVDNAKHREEILNSFATFDGLSLPVVINLTDSSSLLEDLNRAFVLRGAKFKLSFEQNYIKVSGYVQNPDAFAVLVQATEDLVSAYNIKYKIFYQSDIQNRLKSYIKPTDQINLVYTPYAIVYDEQGLYTKGLIKTYQDKLNQKLDSYINFVEAKEQAVNYASLIYGLNNLALKNIGSNENNQDRIDQSIGIKSSSLYSLKHNNQNLALIAQYYDGYLGCVQLLGQEAEAISRAYALPYKNQLSSQSHNRASSYSLLNSFKDFNQGKKDQSEEFLAWSEQLDQDQNEFLFKLLEEKTKENQIKETEQAKLNQTKPTQDVASVLEQKQQDQKANLNRQKDLQNQAQNMFASTIDEELMAVSLKPLPYITLRDGSKVFEGGLLPFELEQYQYTLLKINVNQLTIQRNDGYTFNYTLK